LLRAGISRINDVQNMAGGIPAPGEIDPVVQTQRESDNLRRFQALIGLMMKLYFYNAIEVQRRNDENGKQRFLVISSSQNPDVVVLVDQFKSVLGLDPAKNEFRLVERRMGRGIDEISIQTRSLLQIMAFLAQGVDVPSEQQAQTRTIAGNEGNTAEGDGKGIPFRVRWTRERPDDAFITAEYNGYWFSVANTDIESKRGFNLLVYGFRLLAPERAATAPILSLPTGP
jgi:hypothetical protein